MEGYRNGRSIDFLVDFAVFKVDSSSVTTIVDFRRESGFLDIQEIRNLCTEECRIIADKLTI